MHIKNILARNNRCFSFEFFPPRDAEASTQLLDSINDLIPLSPAYVSVTYGALGTTRELTHDLVVRINKETNLTVVSHLTCVGSGKDEIRSVLEKYQASGIENLMALRGDPPEGQKAFVQPKNGFAHAYQLVSFIKKHFPMMGIGVAGYPEGHPETPNRLKELDYLKRKVDEGADYICTQLFFDNRDFFDFCERCEIAGIHVPILAGIMPVTSRRGMMRLAEKTLCVRYPARLLKAIARASSDEYVEKVGIQWATEQVRNLIDSGVKGVHFYTFNKARATRGIYESLGVTNSAQLIR